MIYLLLAHPGHNRVYFESSKPLCLAELNLALQSFDTPCQNTAWQQVGGLDYLSFEAENALNDREVALLYQLSFTFAVFLQQENLLCPVDKPVLNAFDNGVSSMLKYSGKTNERFTRMCINVARFAHQNLPKQPKLLDPVAGKGTTLIEALALDCNVAGVELSDTSAADFNVFFKKYLQTARYKHEIESIRQSDPKGKWKAKKTLYTFAPDKEQFKLAPQTLHMISCNSAFTDQLFTKNTFDLLVGDLPYGIAHGNTGNVKTPGITRNPSVLLRDCLPAWKKVMKKGGVLVLAWNKHLLSFEDFADILTQNGFEVLTDDVYTSFEHRVDASILRDIIVARKG